MADFPKKYMKKIEDLEFVEVIDGMETDDIKKKILECEGNLYDVDNAKEADAELTATKEKAKELSAPYRETKGIETAKLKYCLFVLESRGISL